jgi:hypothetical protein
MPPKSKRYEPPFDFVNRLFRRESKVTPELKVEQVKADEGVLDRLASVNLSMAEQLAPLAMSSQDPAMIAAMLGASREARACVEARKEVTGGGLAGGTQIEKGVTVQIVHSGEYVSDDFHDQQVPSSHESGIPVQAGSSQSKQ